MEIVVVVAVLVAGYFVNDWLKHILPDYLRELARKRLFKLNLKEETKELLFQGFINDCENQKSSSKEYILMVKFIFTVKNIEIPPKAEMLISMQN